MNPPYPYHILVVSPDSLLVRTIEQILSDKQIHSIQAATAKDGIATIKSHPTLFSLVIVQQELSDMPGVKLLEQVKRLCVGTLRILVTRRFERDLLIYAVNHRLVHKYIGDPEDVEEITAVIESGIRRFNRFREDEELFALAKKQNQKLYKLNCQHVKLTRSRNREIGALNSQIKSMRDQLTYGDDGHPDKLQALVQDMTLAAQTAPDPQKWFDSLFSDVLSTLDNAFISLQKTSGDGHGQ